MASGPTHSLFINTNKKALCFGYNDEGQCGQDERIPYDKPTLIKNLEELNITQVACGAKHSLFLTEQSEVYACGSNRHGQLGIGRRLKCVNMLTKPKLIDYHGPPIKKIGCGKDFSVLLAVDGSLYTFGSTKFGQLGMIGANIYSYILFFFIQKFCYQFDFFAGFDPNLDCVYSPMKVPLYKINRADGIVRMESDVFIMDFSCGDHHTVFYYSCIRMYYLIYSCST